MNGKEKEQELPTGESEEGMSDTVEQGLGAIPQHAVDISAFWHERPFTVSITRDWQLEDFYLSDRGSDVYVDLHFVIDGLRFRFAEIEMRGWTLRVDPAIAGDEHRRTRRYRLTKTVVGHEPESSIMDFESLFSGGGVPLLKAHVLALMNDKDFVRLEHRVGRTQVRIVPKAVDAEECSEKAE